MTALYFINMELGILRSRCDVITDGVVLSQHRLVRGLRKLWGELSLHSALFFGL